MYVWFNKTFSSLHSALRLIREGDTERQFFVVVTASNAHAPAGRQADQFKVEPAGLADEDYVGWCLDFCRQHSIRIFVPGKAASAIAQARASFEQDGTRVLCAADAPTLRLLHNKTAFYDQVQCAMAPAPEWQAIRSLAQFDTAYAAIKERHASVCIKPAQSVYGIGFRRIVEDRSAFDLFIAGDSYKIDLPSLRTMLAQREDPPELLVMEYLPYHEFSVDCLADDGNLRVAIARRKPLHGELGQMIDASDDIQYACREIVAQFRLNGFVNIQFRKGEHGLRVLEVNPRMSGGIAMACLAGINLPLLGLKGFAFGYDRLAIPKMKAGMLVGEANIAEVIA